MPAITFVIIIAACAIAALIIHAARQRYGPNQLPEYGTCHRAPDAVYTVEEAGWVMQERINCNVYECNAKTMAWQVLVEAGRIQPVKDPR
ncbi:hypothetical protein [Nocardia sp. NPDC049707]|uniref:hypothetical protein n=1 Tax=Nocardia sp. NPDC049707 TaxID=3154735 RepID=UPI00341AF030